MRTIDGLLYVIEEPNETIHVVFDPDPSRRVVSHCGRTFSARLVGALPFNYTREAYADVRCQRPGCREMWP